MGNSCIFCLTNSDLTKEHIIPDSLGGSLVINAVCKACNSKIGSDIDAPFINSIISQLPRYLYNIKGKAGHIPNPFSGFGTAVCEDEEIEVRLSPDLAPYMKKKVSSTEEENEFIEINIRVDGADEEEIEIILNKKLERIIRQKLPDITAQEITEKINAIKEVATKEIKTNEYAPEIKYSLSVDIDDIELEYTKIAYEIAFYIFGYDYINTCETARLLRKVVIDRPKDFLVNGIVPCLSTPFTNMFPARDQHIVIVFKNCCYIKLFNLEGVIYIDEKNGKFLLSQDKARVFIFDPVKRTYSEASLAETLANMLV